MKFRICGGLDAPDWILAEIVQRSCAATKPPLVKLTIEVSVSGIVGGPRNGKRSAGSATIWFTTAFKLKASPATGFGSTRMSFRRKCCARAIAHWSILVPPGS